MGCWNQTCGLTQLYIRAGEEVIVVPQAGAGSQQDDCQPIVAAIEQNRKRWGEDEE